MDAEPKRKKARGLGTNRASSQGRRDEAPKVKLSDGPLINQAILDDSAIEEKRAEYDSAQPYPSLVLHSLGSEDRMRAVRDEIVTHIRATFKETDLFKVLQTGDLKNMDELDPEQLAKLPQLQVLRNELYSPEFRKAVERMTGCGSLNERTDMSANVYSQGHHLLCHDDVIGTRRVSYIIYLTSPDDGWTAEDGGGLELYPVLKETTGVPHTSPTTVILPEWNSMAMFTVVPGQSFHSVQEVFAADKPRLSIQGWYHADEEPSHKEMASLSQLKSMAKGRAADMVDLRAGKEKPTEEDLQLLSRWINPTYLKPETWAKVAATFREENSVQLQAFLQPEVAEAVTSALSASDQADRLGEGRVPCYKAGISPADAPGGRWEVVGPPHMQRYLRFEVPDGSGDGGAGPIRSGDVGEMMHRLRTELFHSGACARLLGALTDLEPLAIRSEARRFRPGLDYTVAHYGALTEDDRLDATLCFAVDTEGEDSAVSWEVGEVGGYECYIAAEDDSTEGDVAVYKADEEDDGGLLNVAARSNTLNLVHRDEGIMRFIKYVSHLAPSSRWDVAVEYKVDPHDEDDDGGNAEA